MTEKIEIEINDYTIEMELNDIIKIPLLMQQYNSNQKITIVLQEIICFFQILILTHKSNLSVSEKTLDLCKYLGIQEKGICLHNSCNNIIENNIGIFCKDHNCECNFCYNKKNNEKYCVTHKCLKCDDVKGSSIYCIMHSCPICDSFKNINQQACLYHLCRNYDCYKIIDEYENSLYCSDHMCKFCGGEKNIDGKCEKKLADVKCKYKYRTNCNNMRLLGEKYCYNHKCIACHKKKSSLTMYCISCNSDCDV